MKTKLNIIQVIFATVAFSALASLTHAGTSLPDWSQTKPITTTKEAAAIKPEDTVVMVCGACKTVSIHDLNHVGVPNQGQLAWFALGSKHTCDHCGGEITIVGGKTTDSMQHNCSKCGEGAASCCVTAPNKT